MSSKNTHKMLLLSFTPLNACFPNSAPKLVKVGFGSHKNIAAPAAILSCTEGPLRCILRTLRTEVPPICNRFLFRRLLLLSLFCHFPPIKFYV